MSINRFRSFLTLILPLILAACGASQPGQANSSPYSIGVVIQNPTVVTVWEGFKAGMTDLGYTDGKNISLLYNGPTDTADKVQALVHKYTDAKVNLLLVLGTTTSEMVQKDINGTDQPMLFYSVVDPVKEGFVKSLSAPGTNNTGVTITETLYALRLQWLLKVAPGVKRVYIPYDPSTTSASLAVQLTKDAAPKMGVEIVEQQAKNNDEMVAAIQAIPKDVDAIYLTPGATTSTRIDDLVKASIARKLPLAVYQDGHVAAGGLMSYGTHDDAIGRQLARLADKLVKGAKPASVPVEFAEYYLSINVKTAQAIGLNISDDILQQAKTIVR